MNWLRLASGYINIGQIVRFKVDGDSGEATLSTGLKLVFSGGELTAVVTAIERQLQPPSPDLADADDSSAN